MSGQEMPDSAIHAPALNGRVDCEVCGYGTIIDCQCDPNDIDKGSYPCEVAGCQDPQSHRGSRHEQDNGGDAPVSPTDQIDITDGDTTWGMTASEWVDLAWKAEMSVSPQAESGRVIECAFCARPQADGFKPFCGPTCKAQFDNPDGPEAALGILLNKHGVWEEIGTFRTSALMDDLLAIAAEHGPGVCVPAAHVGSDGRPDAYCPACGWADIVRGTHRDGSCVPAAQVEALIEAAEKAISNRYANLITVDLAAAVAAIREGQK